MDQNYYWIVDTEHLEIVEEKLYGYMITDDGELIMNQIPDKVFDSGCYILIKKNDKGIYIHQDFFGALGIYYYHSDQRYVFSNAYYELVKYLRKEKIELTVNKFYFQHYFFTRDMPLVINDTMINEIQRLSRNIYVEISFQKECIFHEIDYKEFKYDIDSKEAIDILDKWFVKWCKLFRNIIKKNGYLLFDLSGGFDTRMILNMILYSKIPKKFLFVKVDNIKSTTKSKAIADFDISKKILENFGLGDKLIKTNSIIVEGGKELLEKMMNVSLTNFHFSNGVKTLKSSEPYFHIAGLFGDSLHGAYLRPMWYYWYNRRIRGLQDSLFRNNILSFYKSKIYYDGQVKYKEEMMKKFNYSLKDDIESHTITTMEYYYPRFHGGKTCLNLLNNRIFISPYIDSSIYSINYFNGNDKNIFLLPTLIYTRYMPELLEFPFDKERVIEENIKEYSKLVNEKYPKEEVHFEEINDVNLITPNLTNYNSYDDVFKLIKNYFNENVQEVEKFFGKDTVEKCIEDLENMKNPKFLHENRLIMGIYFYLNLRKLL